MGINYTEIVMSFYIYGGNEQSTHKFLAELLGKETIDTNTYRKIDRTQWKLLYKLSAGR